MGRGREGGTKKPNRRDGGNDRQLETFRKRLTKGDVIEIEAPFSFPLFPSAFATHWKRGRREETGRKKSDRVSKREKKKANKRRVPFVAVRRPPPFMGSAATLRGLSDTRGRIEEKGCGRREKPRWAKFIQKETLIGTRNKTKGFGRFFTKSSHFGKIVLEKRRLWRMNGYFQNPRAEKKRGRCYKRGRPSESKLSYVRGRGTTFPFFLPFLLSFRRVSRKKVG